MRRTEEQQREADKHRHLICCRLRAAMADAGLIQADLAKLLSIDQGQMSRMYRGEEGIGLAMARRIERFLQLETGYLSI